jgi:hypothetical protein
MRRISVLATLILAIFMATIHTTPALAADAVRKGNTVTYDGKTLTELKSSDPMPSGLPSGTSGYQYVDTSAKKTYFIFTAGPAGQVNTGQYVYYDGLPTTNFSNPSPPTTVSITNSTAPASTNGAAASSCSGTLTNGIGYVICPVVNFLAAGMDHLYQILSGFLEVRSVQADTNSSLYRMWSVVRDIANICFVIAFLVIVYSQVTSIGVSNYNIKRMLPRLIAAAILVNISFWVSALAVDLSNLLGYSIHDLFMGIFQSLNTTEGYKNMQTLSWANIATAILSGGAIVGGLGAYAHFVVLGASLQGSLIMLIPILVGVLIAVLVALLVMAVRQALIVCLVIISPLAFVAYLLPNTEKYFDKWKDLFMTMLMLFPIFSVIFGASQLAGLAIIQNASGPNAFNLVILGMAVIVAPVVVTPMLVKYSGTLVSRIANMVNNPKKGVMDRTKNWAEGRAQEEKAKVLAGKGRNNWANRRTRAIDHKRRRREGWRKVWEETADTNFTGTNDGVALEAATRHNANKRQAVNNAFGRTAVGRQLDYDARVQELDKHSIEHQHDAHWNEALRTNPERLAQNLEARQNEARANLEKARVERLNTEITAQGDANEYLVNLRGISNADKQGLLRVARDIQSNTAQEAFDSMAKNLAEQEHHKELNEILLKNKMTIDGKTTRAYAAGIGTEDEVLATAVARDRKEFGEAAAYQKELASHFKLNAGQIYDLAMGKRSITVKDDSGNEHTFHANNAYTHDMAAEELFTVGSHNQKMDLLKTTWGTPDGPKGENFEYRRTIQQAAIKSGITGIAPAIGDKTLDDIINGKFNGDDSWQYHSFRQILEGRIKANSLSTANSDSLKLLFAEPSSSPRAQAQFDRLIDDAVQAAVDKDPSADRATVRQNLIDTFERERTGVRQMASQVLRNTTVRQSANSQSVDELKRFAGNLYKGD